MGWKFTSEGLWLDSVVLESAAPSSLPTPELLLCPARWDEADGVDGISKSPGEFEAFFNLHT